MAGRYTTQRWRRSNTQGVQSVEAMKTFHDRPLLTRADLDASNEARLKRDLAAQKYEKRKRFSRGHILNVLKYLPHIRKCRNRCRIPRKVPKKIMETVFALRLV